MSTTVVPKKSTVSGKVPDAIDLALGEIAINHTDGKIYSKHPNDGTIVNLSGAEELHTHSISQVNNLQSSLDAKVDDSEYTNANIKTMYEANADTNAFTDSDKSNLDTAYGWGDHSVAGYELASNKGQPNGYASLTSSGLVPESQLPSSVSSVVEYPSLVDFPATGESDKIYVAADTNKTYRWSGSTYIQITSGAVDSVNGKTGSVVLDTGDVSEGSNLYHTTARARAAISVSGDLSYSNGVISFNETYSTAAEVKTAYESNADTNAYTNAEKSKLTGIEAGAEVNVVDSVNGQTGAVSLNTGDISEGSNLYHTAARAISAIKGDADWNATNWDTAYGWGDHSIAGYAMDSAISTVAKTGSYNDLTNKPDLSVLEEVLEYSTQANFPATGETGKVYIANDTGYMYRWNGSGYTQMTDQTAIWGQITGTLSDQTDLQNALNGKAASSHSHAAGDLPSTIMYEGENVSLLNNDAGYVTAADAPVTSVAGRTGDVTLSTSDVSEGTNLYFTNTRARSAISVSGDLSYSGGVISFNETYSTPTELLTAIKTVDGTTSGLDADLLDGQHGSYYLDWANLTGVPTLDNYGGWTLQTNGVGRGNIASGETVNINSGTAVGVSYSATNNTITINSSDTTYSAGTGLNLNGTLFSLQGEVYTLTEKNKLSNIEAGAQVNVATDLTTSATGTDRIVYSSTGADVTLPAATTTNAGMMTATDKTKLNGVASGAQVNTVDSVNGQTGTVSLSTSHIAEGSNLYYTTTRARGAINVSGDLTYNSGTGVISFNETYSTPSELLTAIKTVDGSISGLDADLLDGNHGSYFVNWNNATNKPSPTITLSGDLSGSVTLSNVTSGTLTATVGDDTHNHTTLTDVQDINFVDGIQKTTASMTTTATTQAVLLEFDATLWGSAEIALAGSTSGSRHMSKFLIVHDGTDAFANEYAVMHTSGELFYMDVDVSGGNVRVLVTPDSTTSTKFKATVDLFGV